MWDRNIDQLPLACPQPGTWPVTQGMYPNRESNQQPFSSQASVQSIEPHQPGLKYVFTFIMIIIYGLVLYSIDMVYYIN